MAQYILTLHNNYDTMLKTLWFKHHSFQYIFKQQWTGSNNSIEKLKLYQNHYSQRRYVWWELVMRQNLIYWYSNIYLKKHLNNNVQLWIISNEIEILDNLLIYICISMHRDIMIHYYKNLHIEISRNMVN